MFLRYLVGGAINIHASCLVELSIYYIQLALFKFCDEHVAFIVIFIIVICCKFIYKHTNIVLLLLFVVAGRFFGASHAYTHAYSLKVIGVCANRQFNLQINAITIVSEVKMRHDNVQKHYASIYTYIHKQNIELCRRQ